MISHAWPPMDVDLRSAVSMSQLREMLAGSTRVKISAGSVTHWEVDAEVLRISATVARRLGTHDLGVARAFIGELSERALSFVYEIPDSAFATVRQRVARHLLDLASARVGEQPGSDHRAGRELVVQVSQQELANAVGTVREVVVRVLRELRQDGVVSRSPSTTAPRPTSQPGTPSPPASG